MKPSQSKSKSQSQSKSRKYRKKSRRQRPQSRRRHTRRRHRIQGGNQVLYYVAYESPTKPGFPMFRVIPGVLDDGQGVVYQFNDFMRDEFGKIEDHLASMKLNRQGIKIPKRVYVKKHIIKEPVYLPAPV